MRKVLSLAMLATTAIATPALARDNSWYIEADAGEVLVDDFPLVVDHNSNVFQASAGTSIGRIGTKPGYDFGGIVGYDFGMFRLEAEASYRRAKVDALSSVVSNTAGTSITGHASALSFMANGLFDLGPDDGLQVYAGGGLGYGHVTAEGAAVLDPFTTFATKGSDNGFAWQLLAGVRYPITGHVDVGLKYRFYNQSNIDLPVVATFSGEGVFTAADTVRTHWRSHSLMLTLGYNFGNAPAPMPVPVPVPVPVPAPVPVPVPVPAPVCEKGPYIVFFDWDKSDITPEASTVLDSAVTAYANCASVPVMLAGYTDRSGSTQYNQGLSDRRNASATSYLTSHGVPGGAISSQGFGESNNRVPTADGVRELQNRRVEITYGPGSGM